MLLLLLIYMYSDICIVILTSGKTTGVLVEKCHSLSSQRRLQTTDWPMCASLGDCSGRKWYSRSSTIRKSTRLQVGSTSLQIAQHCSQNNNAKSAFNVITANVVEKNPFSSVYSYHLESRTYKDTFIRRQLWCQLKQIYVSTPNAKYYPHVHLPFWQMQLAFNIPKMLPDWMPQLSLQLLNFPWAG